MTCSLDIIEVFLLKIHSGAKRVPRLLYENHSPLPSLPPYSSFCLQAIVSLHWHHPLPLSVKYICICLFVHLVFTRVAPYSSLKFKLYLYLCICSDYIQTDCNPRAPSSNTAIPDVDGSQLSVVESALPGYVASVGLHTDGPNQMVSCILKVVVVVVVQLLLLLQVILLPEVTLILVFW